MVFAATGKVTTGTLAAFDGDSGDVRWTRALPDGVVATTPAVGDSTAFVARDDRGVFRVTVRPGQPRTVA